jgi:aspartate ammonia-lyase
MTTVSPRPASVTEADGSRVETDFMGARQIPADAYWGIQTLRAVENFAITGTDISSYPLLVEALAQVKHAAVLANSDLGLIDQVKTGAIVRACHDIEQGGLLDQFVVDVIQGGAGTSTNMNANEVIANRALEILGFDKGDYSVIHPNGHVNMGQSTNDVYPTAIRIATIKASQELLAAMAHLRQVLARKAVEFADVVKVGRTQLQDAVPMTLGQEFSTYAVMVDEDERRIREALVHLHEINLGATAIGTGINTHARLRSTRVHAPAADHRAAAGDREQPGGSNPGLRGFRAVLGDPQTGRGEAVEDL